MNTFSIWRDGALNADKLTTAQIAQSSISSNFSKLENYPRIKINDEIIQDSIIDTLDDKLNRIQKEYENQLQRKAVHIGRGDKLTGRRIHGRGRKVAIRKGSFRNEKGIIGEPTRA
ncbi:MAG: hypothetical protein IJ743_03230 [Bacilli bacterium]|nr:hypothetical protein [Bacilli bacterium]